MGGSISKKDSEPDRLGGRKDQGSGNLGPQYPATLRSPEYIGQTDQSSASLSTQAGLVGPPGAAGVASSVAGLQPGLPPGEQQAVVPTVFRWEHGGNQVYITGTFNNWSRKVPMHRSGNDFLFIQSLPKGRHAYKFVVDDEWRFAPDQPTVADTAGNINNYIDLTTFKPDDDEPISSARRESLPGVPWGQALPDEDEYSKEPPLLPPHLRNIILNSGSPDAADPLALPAPAHVCLNHLYCTAIKDGLMVQATSQRYRRKAVTSVFYSIMPGSSAGSSSAAMPQGQMVPSGPGTPLPGPMGQQQQQQQQADGTPGGAGLGSRLGAQPGSTPQGPPGYLDPRQQAMPAGLQTVQLPSPAPGQMVAPPPLPQPGQAEGWQQQQGAAAMPPRPPVHPMGPSLASLGMGMGMGAPPTVTISAKGNVTPPTGGVAGVGGLHTGSGQWNGAQMSPTAAAALAHVAGQAAATGPQGYHPGRRSSITSGHPIHVDGARRASVDAVDYAAKVAAAYNISGGGNYAGY